MADAVVAAEHRVADFFARWALSTVAFVLVLLGAGLGWGVGAGVTATQDTALLGLAVGSLGA